MAARTLLGGGMWSACGHAKPDAACAKRSLKQAVIDSVAECLRRRTTLGHRQFWGTPQVRRRSCHAGASPGMAGEGSHSVRADKRLREGEAIAIAPLLAAATCAAEVFAYHAGDHSMAAPVLGLSLWNPGADWLANDATESAPWFLPSRLWMIGLGNLGQAYAWLLAALPYEDRSLVNWS